MYILIGKLILDILNNTTLDSFFMFNNSISNLERLPPVSLHVPP